MEYKIWHGGRTVGNVYVEIQGLYAKLFCQCLVDYGKPVKISVDTGEKTILLGTCIPEGNILTLEKKLSLKNLGTRQLRFYISNIPEENRQRLREDQPIVSLEKIMQAHLVREENHLFLEFTDRKAQGQQDNGQNP